MLIFTPLSFFDVGHHKVTYRDVAHFAGFWIGVYGAYHAIAGLVSFDFLQARYGAPVYALAIIITLLSLLTPPTRL